MTWVDDIDKRIKTYNKDFRDRLVVVKVKDKENVGPESQLQFFLPYNESQNKRFIQNYIKEQYNNRYMYVSHYTCKYHT